MIQLYCFWAYIQQTLKSTCQRDTYTSMFIAAVFTVTRKWSQTICPSRNEWIQKIWYIFTVEFYSTIKKNKIYRNDGSGKYYSKLSNPDAERNIS